jgi:hypothetical protein
MLLLVAAITVGACADDQSITSPPPNASHPGATPSSDATLDATDAPVITIAPARTGVIRVKSGVVELSGTVTCKAGILAHVVAYLEQYDRQTNDTVAGFGETYVACVDVPITWFVSLTMAPGDLLPQRGKADVLFRASLPGTNAVEVKRSIRLVEDVEN